MVIDEIALRRALKGIQAAPNLVALRKAREERDNVRIEELSEAIENLAVAISANALSKVDPDQPPHKMVTDYLVNSRQWVRDALRDFMAPNLHLVNGEARQTDASVPPAERVRCAKCGQHTVCRNILCLDWAEAIKAHLKPAEEELPPDDRPRAA